MHECHVTNFFSVQVVLKNPFLRVCTPSTLIIHWAPLFHAILWSLLVAQTLFLASCPSPGPSWWIFYKRQSTCPLMATIDSLHTPTQLLITPGSTPRDQEIQFSFQPSIGPTGVPLHLFPPMHRSIGQVNHQIPTAFSPLALWSPCLPLSPTGLLSLLFSYILLAAAGPSCQYL